MDNSLIAIALLALSTVLIIAEIFIPSAGMLAIGTLLSLIASFYFAWAAWWVESPTLFFGFTAFALIFLPSVAIGSFAVLPRTSFGRRILLPGPTPEEVMPHDDQADLLAKAIGQRAITATPLTPHGFIIYDRNRINACSEGMIIDKGVDVEIVRISGNRIYVREIDETTAQITPLTKPETKSDDSDTIDFDLPDEDSQTA